MGRVVAFVLGLCLACSFVQAADPTPESGVRPAVFDSRSGEKKPADKKATDKTSEESAEPAVDVPLDRLGKEFRLLGKLKTPLGQVVKVQGLIVAGKGKGYEDGLLIRVFRVNGQATQEFIQLKVEDYYQREEIPNLRPGLMCELEGFETGGFVGVPAEAVLRGGQIAQTTDFQFRHEFKVFETTEVKWQPFSPVDFLGRDMLVQGQAISENGSAYIKGAQWKLLVDNGTPWPRSTEGKTIEARGVIRTIGKSTTYRLENSGKANNARLVSLADQVGKSVALRGQLTEKNGQWSFKYRGQFVSVEGLKELAAKAELPGDVQVTGVLEVDRVPVSGNDSFIGEPLVRGSYVIRKATVKPCDTLLAIERAEPVE